MSSQRLRARRSLAPLLVLTLAVGLLQTAVARGGRNIEERHAADPQGTVEIVSVAGSVEVIGWDRAEVEVTGTVGEAVERVDLIGSGDRTSVRVVPRPGPSAGDSEARLTVHLPAKSSLRTTVVSANLKVSGLQGNAQLQTVSGDIKGETGGDVQLSSVSGDVELTARSAKNAEVKTISGDIDFKGGSGDLEVTTVSGAVKVEVGTVNRGRFKTVSGDMAATLTLAADGQLEGETVSGDLKFDFVAAPAADFDLATLSGEIDNCFGPKPNENRYGPGSRLTFKNGEGRARVRMESRSGDLRLCTTGGSHRGQTAWISRTGLADCTLPVRYVF